MKRFVKLSLVLSCFFIFSGCGNRNEESKSSEKLSTTSEKIVKKKSTKTKTSLSTESSISESKSTIQSVEPSSNTPIDAIISSAPQEEPAPEQDPRIGQVVTSPHGHQSTVLRILPNGEMVISEQTSQADYNNDGILTFEELKSSVNPMYGKKGMGWVNNPKKAAYNKVYNKTTKSVTSFGSSQKRKSTSKTNYSNRDSHHNEQRTGCGCWTLLLAALVIPILAPFFPIAAGIALFVVVIVSLVRLGSRPKQDYHVYQEEYEPNEEELEDDNWDDF